MRNKGIIVFLGVVGTLLVVSVIGLFILLGTNSDPASADDGNNQDVGLLGNPDNVMREPANIVSGDDMQNQYDQNPSYDEITVEQLQATITQKLSTGDFTGLDNYLQDVNSRYSVHPETPNENGDVLDQSMVNYTLLINNLRMDIAIMNSMTPDNAAVMFSSFNTPEVCAAALVYTDIDEKMDVFLNEDARIYNKVPTGTAQSDAVNLRESDLTDAERGELLVALNNIYNNEYLEVKAYDCNISGLPYRLLIAQQAHGQWRPYTILSLCTNGEDANVATAYELKQMKAANPYMDFSTIAYDIGGTTGAPGMIDRNETEGFGEQTDPNQTDPVGTEDPTQTEPPVQTEDPNGTTSNPSSGDEVMSQLSEADQQAMNDLQAIVDNCDPNTTNPDELKTAIDGISAIAARPEISDLMRQALNTELEKLQILYNNLMTILGRS